MTFFSSKTYVYPTKSRKYIPNKVETFYKEIKNKRKKGEKIRLQAELEFKPNKIYEINSKYNVHTFYTTVREGKSFAAEQKIRELKKRILHLKSLERSERKSVRIKPYNIIRKSRDNINNLPTKKVLNLTKQDWEEIFGIWTN